MAKSNFHHPFGELAARYRTLRKVLPRQVSAIAAQEFRANFRRQGLRTTGESVEKWQPRQSSKGARRAILVKTGALRRSIKAAPTYNEARVVNNMPYAAIHNRGGNIKGQKRAFATNIKSGLTRLRQSGSKATMPARPFMATTPALLDDVSAHILKQLEGVFNTSSR